MPHPVLTCHRVFPRLFGFILTLGLLFAGCSAGATDAKGNGDPQPSGVLPDGWTVSMPESEFSTIACFDGLVLAGGLNGLYVKRDGSASWSEIRNGSNAYRMVKGILQDQAGRLWIGQEDGLVCLPGFREAMADGEVAPSSGISLQKVAGRDIGAVNGLMRDEAGNLYAGTFNGALRFGEADIEAWLRDADETPFTWMGEAEGLTSPMVNAMLCDARGILWFGAYIARGGGVAVLGDGRRQMFNHDNGLLDDYVTTIAEESDGSVWVGTGVYLTGGATRFVWKETGFVPDPPLTLEDGLAGAKVRFIHIDADRFRWFCSEYDGIAVFGPDGRRTRVLTVADGLPDNEVKRMAPDSDGGIWFACRRGILHMTPGAVALARSAPG